MDYAFKQCHINNYREGRRDGIRFLVIHYTANDGDTAKNNADYFAREGGLGASAHYFVDEGDTVWQSVKEGDTAWHCGARVYEHPDCRNDSSIGIELCSRKGGDGYYFKDETVTNAAELSRALMKKYDIPYSNVVRHYDVTGKLCPAPFVEEPALWQAFKNRLGQTVEEAIAALAADGVIETPGYWTAHSGDLQYLGRLLVRLSNAAGPDTDGAHAETAEQAIEKLAARGVIETEGYWLKNYTRVLWLDRLLIRASDHVV